MQNLHAQNFREVQMLLPNDFDDEDLFGISTDLSGDFAIVGAQWEDEDLNGENFIQNAGSAYIFQRQFDGSWVQIQKLTSPHRQKNGFFGGAVAIHENVIMVGSYYQSQDQNGDHIKDRAGAVYVFEKNANGLWDFSQKLLASDLLDIEGLFGHDIRMDGERALITAVRGRDSWNGAVYVFEKTESGEWRETQKLTGTNTNHRDGFGNSLDLLPDQLVIGASGENFITSQGIILYNAGAVSIFKKDGTGEWVEDQKITRPTSTKYTYFGFDLAVEEEHLLVSASRDFYGDGGNEPEKKSGAVYAYHRNSSEQWEFTQKFAPADYAEDDQFGFSMAMDGNLAFISANLKNKPFGEIPIHHGGALYLFEKGFDGQWVEKQSMVPSDRVESDGIGHELCLENGVALASSYLKSHPGPNSFEEAGAVFAFEDSVLHKRPNLKENELLLYPNPTSGFFTIYTGPNFEGEEFSIRISTLEGKVLLETSSLISPQFTQDIGYFPDGIYILSLVGEGHQSAHKLIKTSER